MPFVFFIFMAPSSCWLYAGVLLWGIGMGAQESTLKAAVAAIVPKRERAVGYGIFETGFGVSWFIGSFLLGILLLLQPENSSMEFARMFQHP